MTRAAVQRELNEVALEMQNRVIAYSLCLNLLDDRRQNPSRRVIEAPNACLVFTENRRKV
jgi:hypothetical protein